VAGSRKSRSLGSQDQDDQNPAVPVRGIASEYDSLLNSTRFPLLFVCRDSNLSRPNGISESGTTLSCPRCRAAMDEILRIEPALREKGLIAYECPNCVYVTSVLLEPRTPKGSRS